MAIITVIVPAYNTERYIMHTLRSVQAQSLSDFICIVVDDGSTDNMAQIVADTVGHDVRFLLVQQKNAGECAARNAGSPLCRHQYSRCWTVMTLGIRNAPSYPSRRNVTVSASKPMQRGARLRRQTPIPDMRGMRQSMARVFMTVPQGREKVIRFAHAAAQPIPRGAADQRDAIRLTPPDTIKHDAKIAQ